VGIKYEASGEGVLSYLVKYSYIYTYTCIYTYMHKYQYICIYTSQVGIKYEASGEGAPAAPVTVSAELLLPCSSFLLPKDIHVDDFQKLMGSSDCPYKSSTVIEAGGLSLSPFYMYVCNTARKASWNKMGVEPGNQEGPGC